MTRMGQQVIESSPQSSKEEKIPTNPGKGPVFYENNSEGKDNPIVSGTIIPMMARVEIVVPSLGARGGHHGVDDLL